MTSCVVRLLSVWFTPTGPCPPEGGSRSTDLLLTTVAILLVLNLAAILLRKGRKGGRT
jgi:hypothetical protein